MTVPLVLYAEDEENDAFFLQLALVRAAPAVRLRVVRDGREAIEYLSSTGAFADREMFPAPTLVLLDFNLPLLSGLEVLHWVRQRPEFDDTPVLIFSSSGRAEDRHVANMLGADHYLMKPMSGEQFTHVARELADDWLAGRRRPGDAQSPTFPRT